MGLFPFAQKHRATLHVCNSSCHSGRAHFLRSPTCTRLRAREPGIHASANSVLLERWIPGSCFARPGMTIEFCAAAFLQTCAITPVVCGAGAPSSLFKSLQRPGARLRCSSFASSNALEVFLIRALKKRGRAERRTRDASAASCVKVSETHEHSHHEYTGSPGVPHAMVFSACFVLSPEVFVSKGTEGVHARRSARRLSIPRCAATGIGTTRLGPARKGVTVGRISIPAATRSAVVSA